MKSRIFKKENGEYYIDDGDCTMDIRTYIALLQFQIRELRIEIKELRQITGLKGGERLTSSNDVLY